jgi:predicted nuclease of predicted toxin-antitoxin system
VRFLADENVPRGVVNWLRAGGIDTTWASELGSGEQDTGWLGLANSEQRIIITSDKDFGDLVFRDRLASFGIVLLRLDDLPAAEWVVRFQEVWSVIEANPTGRFIVVTPNRIRVRKLS